MEDEEAMEEPTISTTSIRERMNKRRFKIEVSIIYPAQLVSISLLELTMRGM
jgi:hypothetical protein